MKLLLNALNVPENFGADGVSGVAVIAPAYEIATMRVTPFLERVDVNPEVMGSLRG